MCSLTIERAQYEPAPNHARSCDGLSAQQSKGITGRLSETDRVRLDVAIAASNEIYSWVGEDRFNDRDVFDLVRDGALQTGGYSSFLASIFQGDAASFTYNSETKVGGRTLAEFGFRVARELSSYKIGSRRGHEETTGYEGSFLADPKTGDLVRLLVRTSGPPEDTGVCEAATTLDYGQVRLNDSEFLLPREAHLDILNTDGGQFRNRTVYSSCHEFTGESVLKFDEPAREASVSAPVIASKTAGSRSAPTFSIPAGTVFGVRFTQPIDTKSAAAGDRIQAKAEQFHQGRFDEGSLGS
jgi:hypothetical protein